MKIINTNQIEEALRALKNGEIIIFPTETSYGIGCDATNKKAVEKIFQIKNRRKENALPIIIPDKESAGKYVKFSETAKMLAQVFWPGGLNIIAKVKDGTPVASLCSSDGTQCVRVSSHPFASKLAKSFGRPIVATSANISGQENVYSAEKAKEIFSEQDKIISLIVDAGELPKVAPSTTVKVVDHKIEIVRQGEVKIT